MYFNIINIYTYSKKLKLLKIVPVKNYTENLFLKQKHNLLQTKFRMLVDLYTISKCRNHNFKAIVI